MNTYEMEGFLRGQCVPRDLLVNESNAAYLVRKLSEIASVKAERDALTDRVECLSGMLTESRVATKSAEERADALAVENAALKSKAAELVHEASEVYSAYNATIREPDGDFMDMQTLYEMQRIETPATSAALAAIQAHGVEKFAKALRVKGDDAFFDAIAEAQANAADEFAAKLREAK